MRVKLVLFDALYTIVKPRAPIHVQYAQVFEPYLGTVDPMRVKAAFKIALKGVQRERPAYASSKDVSMRPGAAGWWDEVIRRTAVGAGSDPTEVEQALPGITSKLMRRFGSREGYELYADTLSTLQALEESGIRTGLVSNCDAQMRDVLEDLGALRYLDPVLLSEEQGIEKPARGIWARALKVAGMVSSHETLHVGDNLKDDYIGAKQAGLNAMLIRRLGPDDGESKEADERLDGLHVIHSLGEILEWTERL